MARPAWIDVSPKTTTPWDLLHYKHPRLVTDENRDFVERMGGIGCMRSCGFDDAGEYAVLTGLGYRSAMREHIARNGGVVKFLYEVLNMASEEFGFPDGEAVFVGDRAKTPKPALLPEL